MITVLLVTMWKYIRYGYRSDAFYLNPKKPASCIKKCQVAGVVMETMLTGAKCTLTGGSYETKIG